MSMISHLRPTNPFWKITAPEGQHPNPLNYHCAPNEATPDYVASREILDFLGFGLRQSWLSPETFSLWEHLEENDIKDLREGFLSVIEDLVLRIYLGEIEPRAVDFDADNYHSLTVSDHVDEQYRTAVVNLQWMPDRVFGHASRIMLCVSVIQGKGGNEEHASWLHHEAIRDRQWVWCAITHARAMIKSEAPLDERWEKLRDYDVPDVCPVYPEFTEYLKRCNREGRDPDSLQQWYDREYGGYILLPLPFEIEPEDEF